MVSWLSLHPSPLSSSPTLLSPAPGLRPPLTLYAVGVRVRPRPGAILDIQVPVELQCICEGSLKGNGSLLNAWAEML